MDFASYLAGAVTVIVSLSLGTILGAAINAPSSKKEDDGKNT